MIPRSGAVARGVPRTLQVPFRSVPSGRRTALLSITIHKTSCVGNINNINGDCIDSTALSNKMTSVLSNKRLKVTFAEGFIPVQRDAGNTKPDKGVQVMFECTLIPPSSRSVQLLDVAVRTSNCVPDIYADVWGVSCTFPCRYNGLSLFEKAVSLQLSSETWSIQMVCRDAASFGYPKLVEQARLIIPWSKLLMDNVGPVEAWVEFPVSANLDAVPGKVKVMLSVEEEVVAKEDFTNESFIGGGHIFVWEKGTFNVKGTRPLLVLKGELTSFYEDGDRFALDSQPKVFATQALSNSENGQFAGSIPVIGIRGSAIISMSTNQRGDRVEASLPIDHILLKAHNTTVPSMTLPLISRKRGIVAAAGVINISAAFVPYVEGVMTIRIDTCQLLSRRGLENAKTSIRLVVPGCYNGFSSIVDIQGSSGPLVEFQFPINTYCILSEVKGALGLTAILEIHSVSPDSSVAVCRGSVAFHPLFNIALKGTLGMSAGNTTSATAKMRSNVDLDSIDGPDVTASMKVYVDFTILAIDPKITSYSVARKFAISNRTTNDATQELKLKQLFVKTDADGSGEISFDEVGFVYYCTIHNHFCFDSFVCVLCECCS